MQKLVLFVALLFCALPGCIAATRYVAPDARGKADGSSHTNAADFLDTNFWANVQKLVQKETVTVKFAGGDYKRAYIEKPLVLENIGSHGNKLVLEGEAHKTIFSVPTGHPRKSVVFELINAQQVVIRNFTFTGSGEVGYVFRISSANDGKTENILVENCIWNDMRGVVFGATGCHKSGTTDVTYKNCVFKRIGLDSHSHHMYHAHGAKRIQVVNCHFEDCTGDYVRFRDQCDSAIVSSNTFIRNKEFPVYPFISIPLFNNVNPGDERFATHYRFTDNHFTDGKYAVAFHHYGYTPTGLRYLLTAEEGKRLREGDSIEKRKILLEHFGLDTHQIFISKNSYTRIATPVGVGSFAKYGAGSLGFDGWADISGLFQ